MYKFYHIHQCTILPPSTWKSRSVLQCLDRHCYGNSYYEGKHLALALTNILLSEEEWVFGHVMATVPGHKGMCKNPLLGYNPPVTALVRYYCRKSQVDEVEYLIHNLQMIKEKQLEEWYVGLDSGDDLMIRFDWMKEAIIWRGKKGKRLLTNQIKHSIAAISSTPMAGYSDKDRQAMIGMLDKPIDEILLKRGCGQ